MLKFILTVFIIIWVLRGLAQLFMPLILKNVVRKAQEHSNNQNRQQNYNKKTEGEIHIDYTPPTTGKKKPFFANSKDKGDFVDFEEIK